MGESEGGETTPAALASPLEDDDLLREILLRLPPQPSLLPRASAVCKRWFGLITDPKFILGFRIHHQKPPLIGVFQNSNQGIVFIPVLDPPDRIPPLRFSLGYCSSSDDFDVLDCRHGLVLVKDWGREEIVVCDPITHNYRWVSAPAEFKNGEINGVVICAAGNQPHVHDGCHTSPFKVVLMTMSGDVNPPTVCVYSSETCLWGNLISTEAPYRLGGNDGTRATLFGNAFYWLSMSNQILKFDLDGQSLAVITGPLVTNDILHQNNLIIPAEDGALGFAVLSFPHMEMWRRNVNGHGGPTWVPWKTIEIHSILGLSAQIERQLRWRKNIRGYDEDTGSILINVDDSVYVVQLKSMKYKKLYESIDTYYYHPFKSFYTPGKGMAAVVLTKSARSISAVGSVYMLSEEKTAMS